METTDTDFFDELTDADFNEISYEVSIISRWRRVMAEQGIKVLSLGLSSDEEWKQAQEWYNQQTEFSL